MGQNNIPYGTNIVPQTETMFTLSLIQHRIAAQTDSFRIRHANSPKIPYPQA